MSNNRNGRKNPFGKIFIEINKVLLSNSYLTKKYLVTVSGEILSALQILNKGNISLSADYFTNLRIYESCPWKGE